MTGGPGPGERDVLFVWPWPACINLVWAVGPSPSHHLQLLAYTLHRSHPQGHRDPPPLHHSTTLLSAMRVDVAFNFTWTRTAIGHRRLLQTPSATAYSLQPNKPNHTHPPPSMSILPADCLQARLEARAAAAGSRSLQLPPRRETHLGGYSPSASGADLIRLRQTVQAFPPVIVSGGGGEQNNLRRSVPSSTSMSSLS